MLYTDCTPEERWLDALMHDFTNTEETIYTELEVETISSCRRDNMCLNPVSIADIGIERSYGNYFGSGIGMLYVPIVENAQNFNTGGSLCWAASSGSIVSYRKNIEPALNAYEVYYLLYYDGISSPSSYHVSNLFEHYNLTYTYAASGANYNTVASLIASNRPIYAGIATASSEPTTHAVVICGYQSAQGGYYFYTLMDPNNTSYVTVNVSYNSTSFYYPSNSGTYTYWARRFH